MSRRGRAPWSNRLLVEDCLAFDIANSYVPASFVRSQARRVRLHGRMPANMRFSLLYFLVELTASGNTLLHILIWRPKQPPSTALRAEADRRNCANAALLRSKTLVPVPWSSQQGPMPDSRPNSLFFHQHTPRFQTTAPDLIYRVPVAQCTHQWHSSAADREVWRNTSKRRDEARILDISCQPSSTTTAREKARKHGPPATNVTLDAAQESASGLSSRFFFGSNVHDDPPKWGS